MFIGQSIGDDLRSFTMADQRERDQRGDDQETAGQQGQSSEYGEQGPEADGSRADEPMNTQGREGRFGGESAGQTPDPNPGGGMSGQPIGGNDSNTGSGTTLTQGADFDESSDNPGRGTRSNIGAPSLATSQTSAGSSGVSGGKGFIGSEAGDSGSDFAREGRGALEDKEEETGGSSA
jgi:hypothetical protein